MEADHSDVQTDAWESYHDNILLSSQAVPPPLLGYER